MVPVRRPDADQPRSGGRKAREIHDQRLTRRCEQRWAVEQPRARAAEAHPRASERGLVGRQRDCRRCPSRRAASEEAEPAGVAMISIIAMEAVVGCGTRRQLVADVTASTGYRAEK